MKNNLFVVGIGIKFVSQITTEASVHITKSDKVLYLLNEPAIEEWIVSKNSNSESLDFLYKKNKFRNDSYNEIANYIVETLQKIHNLCLVMYGHPTVLCMPALLAAQAAKNKGHYVKIFPGISSEACLFADLMIDPGQSGLQSFEATDFLLYQRNFDVSSHLVLWQINNIGDTLHNNEKRINRNLQTLIEYLLQKYPANHSVIVYEAAQYPQLEPRIDSFELSTLITAKLSPLSTLYIPPSHQKIIDQKMVDLIRL